MRLIHNERTKLTASWFNTMAAAFVGAGLFAPLAALAYGLAELRIGVSTVVGMVTVCVAGGAILHVIGWTVLGRLRE